jgi:hypothetical protein
MIISDLSHFEEVVAEAPNIVGGETTTLGKEVDPKVAEELKKAGLGDLLKITLNVSPASVSTSGGTSSAETAVGTTPEGDKVKVSESTSTATAAK